VKLIDTDETVIIVTGSDIRAEERDRPTAYRLKEEVDTRSDGQRFRRAVVVGDLWYLENRVFQLNPTVAIGGPGVNALAARLTNTLPVAWSQSEQAFVQADLEGEQKRVLLWGMDAGATMAAVQAFTSQGYLEDLLRRIWKFRTETYV
jgi:hypothetical protein